MEIPTQEDWAGYEKDLDAQYAHKIFFGKSIEEIIPLIQQNPIERAEELRFMPTIPFRYYILAFRDYLLSETSRGDADAASCYLRLIDHKVNKEPDSVNPVMPDLIESVRTVAEAQSFYDADLDIYGDFKEIRARIIAAYESG